MNNYDFKDSIPVLGQLAALLATIYDKDEALAIAGELFYFYFPEQTNIQHNALLISDFNEGQQAQLKNDTARLMQQEPIQYIIGEVTFLDVRIKVNSAVLIPRPETEEITHLLFNEIISSRINTPAILDIGTGSGCIPVALAKKIPAAGISSLDISSDALAVAIVNAQLNNVAVNFIQGDILNPAFHLHTKFDYIISNPPYITEKEKAAMSSNVLLYEPESALFVADEQPLLFYQAIKEFAEKHLNVTGQLWLEINPLYAADMMSLFEHSGFKKISMVKDMYGKERLLKAMQ